MTLDSTNSRTAYRLGAALAVFTALALFWIIGAVGLIGASGDASDRVFLVVYGVAVAGSLAARFRARGMALAMGATAVVQLALGGVAVASGWVPDYNSPFEVLALCAGFAAMWGGAGWLFGRAAPTATG